MIKRIGDLSPEETGLRYKHSGCKSFLVVLILVQCAQYYLDACRALSITVLVVLLVFNIAVLVQRIKVVLCEHVP